MNIRYETLMLTSADITPDEISTIEKGIENLVSKAEGKLSTFDQWGKLRLSYPVAKSGHGSYMLARYEVPTESISKVVKSIEDFLKIKCTETVLRHVNVRLRKGAPATYQRPEINEHANRGAVDAFFKENKIENMLSSVDAAGKDFSEDEE